MRPGSSNSSGGGRGGGSGGGGGRPKGSSDGGVRSAPIVLDSPYIGEVGGALNISFEFDTDQKNTPGLTDTSKGYTLPQTGINN